MIGGGGVPIAGPKAFQSLVLTPLFSGKPLEAAAIAVASPFVNPRHAGFRPDAARFPALSALIGRMHARPSFKACVEKERTVFGKR